MDIAEDSTLDIPILRAPFEGLPWLVAFTTLARDERGRRFDFGAGDGSACAAQRRALAREVAPLELSWLELEHGSRCVEVAGRAPQRGPVPADAAIVDRPGHAVALTTADCLPIIVAVASPQPAVALIHAGWRGLAAGVIENALAALVRPHGCELCDLQGAQAYIGPCIHAQDYEVGEECCAALLASPQVRPAHFLPSGQPGHYLADLPAMAAAKLEAAGIAPMAIRTCPLSTKRDRHLHSVRRDATTAGRMATLVGIRYPPTHSAL
jgi:YfiH family protein